MESKSYYVHLPSIKLGQKTIRCVCLHRSNKFHVDVQCSIAKGELLFLAADVLTGCRQPTNNFPRIHSRYAKNGLAAKVQLKGIHIHGWSSPVWCYTVQGLFKVVFEYQNRDVQKGCLQLLKDMWLRTLDFPALPENLELEYDKNHTSLYKEVNNTAEPAEGKNCDLGDLPHTPQSSCDTSDYDKHVNSGGTPLGSMEKEESIGGAPRALSMVCRYVLHTRKLFKASEQAVHLLGLVQKVVEVLQLGVSHFGDEYDLSCGFPFHLIEIYFNIIQDKTISKKFQSKFSVPLHKNVALCVIAEWLGKEYYSLQKMICEEVDRFKTSHIDCIDNLPSPVKLVRSLFPQCMILLLQNWMAASSNPPRKTCLQGQVVKQVQAGSDSSNGDQQNTPSCSVDKLTSFPSMEPLCKRSRQEEKEEHHYGDSDEIARNDPVDVESVFPFIQLILEFTNKALISGVAHVVYSRILHM